MQNSIWKIVSLAGVVGVCFLLVLMAQNGLQQNDQKLAEDDAPAPEIVTELGEPASGAVEWPAPGVTENNQWEPELAQHEPSVSNEPVVDPFANDSLQSEPFDAFPVAEERPAFPEIPDLGETNLAASDPFTDPQPASRNPVDQGAEPFSAPPAEMPVAEGQDLRALALELMQKAYREIDAAELQLARGKAVAAGELPVAWGPLEESPPMLIARIDAMLKAADSQNVAATTTEPQPFPSDILPVSGEQPLITEKSTPALITEFGPDPFADTLPETSEPLPRIDLPAIEDAPAAFEPFAETLPEPAAPISLPALDAPIGAGDRAVRVSITVNAPAASAPEVLAQSSRQV
ncbi:MAG: hypothetical protein HQ518_29270, partial [Rhodopirellula sp.]|nr:hypothetical protein [Rhodopirellula sp.]